MKAWHFVGSTLRDGKAIPPDGVRLSHSGPMVMCESGLHFSLEPFDALQYAPGEVLCYVEVEDFELGDDKGVARHRTILQRQNVRELLYDFACAEAWALVKDKNPPAIVEQYLTSKGKERDAARWSAWDAARDVARDAAWNAVWVAAGSAALCRACGAAWYAAKGAAWYAAKGVARDVARERQRATFNNMVYKAFNLN